MNEYNSYTRSLTGGNILLHPPHVGLYHTLETPTCKPTVTQPNHAGYNSNPYVQKPKKPYPYIHILDCITPWRPQHAYCWCLRWILDKTEIYLCKSSSCCCMR